MVHLPEKSVGRPGGTILPYDAAFRLEEVSEPQSNPFIERGLPSVSFPAQPIGNQGNTVRKGNSPAILRL